MADQSESASRPTTPTVITYDDLGARRPMPRSSWMDVVPFELARDGDVQVRVGDSHRARTVEPAVLDALADISSLTSIIAATPIRLRRPMPQIEELLTTLVPPDAETLRNLPNLKRLHSGRMHSPTDRYLDTASLPSHLEKLSVARHSLAHGWSKKVPSGAEPRFAELARFERLTSLDLDDCWPDDSVAPLAALTGLQRLRCNASNGWSKLAGLTHLEVVSAIRPRLPDLRAWKRWTRVRALSLGNAGVKSLHGLEVFRDLERLHLFLLKVGDLSPLTALPHLQDITLLGVNNAQDLTPLGTLPALRRLEISQAGIDYKDIVHVRSLAPLANARALEELKLSYTVVDDADTTPLMALPRLRRVQLYGELGDTVEKLRVARPDIEVSWVAPLAVPGEKIGDVYVRPPLDGTTDWWLSEDLTELLGEATNAEAERRLISALRSEDTQLLARLDFDTEASAVTIRSARKNDIASVAALIARLGAARKSKG